MADAARVYLNGRLVDAAGAAVPAADRGFLYGDGFFETTRVVAAAPLLLERHIARLSDSCRAAGFGPCVDAAAFAEGAARLIAANGVREGRLRITVSRGAAPGLAPGPARPPTVLMQAHAMDLPPLDAAAPIALALSDYRVNERSPVVRHKGLSYQANLLALAAGRDAGADEIVLLNSRDRLAEGAVSNLFLVRGGAVRTPSVECGLLPGITRAVVLELCRREGIPAEEGVYALDDLAGADEVFCTNSLRGLMPVQRLLGGPAYPADRPLTCALTGFYAAFVLGL